MCQSENGKTNEERTAPYFTEHNGLWDALNDCISDRPAGVTVGEEELFEWAADLRACSDRLHREIQSLFDRILRS